MADDPQVVIGKQIEFYAAATQAWFNTKLELDKSLLTLSTAAIGLLLTLLGLGTFNGLGFLIKILFLLALSGYLGTIAAVLIVFKRNSQQIQLIINKAPNSEKGNKNLKQLDTVAHASFLFASIFTVLIAAYIIIEKKTDEKPAQDITKHELQPTADGKSVLVAPHQTIYLDRNRCISRLVEQSRVFATKAESCQPY